LKGLTGTTKRGARALSFAIGECVAAAPPRGHARISGKRGMAHGVTFAERRKDGENFRAAVQKVDGIDMDEIGRRQGA
jgi:hypothetical protein